MKLTRACFGTAVFLMSAWSGGAGADELDFPLDRINDNVYVIYGPFDLPNEDNRGFRNNIVIVTTSAGVVVFDPGGSAAAGELAVRKVRELTQQPIVAVFDSHAHGDHWLGNEAVKRSFPDAVIYGHPALKSKVEGPNGQFWLDTINRLTNGTAGGTRVVPIDKTVNDGDVVTVGDTEFRILHTGKAHTDNDIMIEIAGQDVLYTGDVVRNGLLGIMEDDASFQGNIAAIDLIVKKHYAHYIPGHGKAGGASVPMTYRAYLDTVRATVAALYEDGLADYEMKPEVMQRVSQFGSWAGFELRIGAHINRAYLEVEAESF